MTIFIIAALSLLSICACVFVLAFCVERFFEFAYCHDDKWWGGVSLWAAAVPLMAASLVGSFMGPIAFWIWFFEGAL